MCIEAQRLVARRRCRGVTGPGALPLLLLLLFGRARSSKDVVIFFLVVTISASRGTCISTRTPSRFFANFEVRERWCLGVVRLKRDRRQRAATFA